MPGVPLLRGLQHLLGQAGWETGSSPDDLRGYVADHVHDAVWGGFQRQWGSYALALDRGTQASLTA
jgi:hypothetical protein